MKNNFDVQTKKEKKEVAFLATNSEKVVFVGSQISGVPKLPRYSELFLIFSLMEQDLEEELPFDVNLSIVTLETFAKAFISLKEEKKYANRLLNKTNGKKNVKVSTESSEHDFAYRLFNNISAKNLFRFINDLTNLRNFSNSDEMADKFLSTDVALKSLNSFYDEYDDIYDECAKRNYSMLYLYEKVSATPSNVIMSKDNTTLKKLNDEKIDKEFENLPKFAQILKGNNKTMKNIVGKLYIELKNETTGKLEDIQEEYYLKIQAIDKNFDEIMANVIVDGSYYSIDELYDVYEELKK